MKEATGELNITVITILAIAAVAGLFYAFVWPSLRGSLQKGNCDNLCGGEDTTATAVVNQGNTVCTCQDGRIFTIDAQGNLTGATL